MDDITSLAHSMIRLHGIERAVKLTDRYAADYASKGDARGYERWTAVAEKIADLIAIDRRFGKAARA